MRLRRAGAEEARRRIVSAAAELHARHGALGTTHPMIAARAGVSVPTVYKYFPNRDRLIPACTGLVLSGAPVALDEGLFAGREPGPARVRALVDAVFRLHEHLAPWSRWTARDCAELPALRRFLREEAGRRRRLLRLALPPGASEEAVLLADALIDWPAYSALREAGCPPGRAADAASDAVVAVTRSRKEES